MVLNIAAYLDVAGDAHTAQYSVDHSRAPGERVQAHRRVVSYLGLSVHREKRGAIITADPNPPSRPQHKSDRSF